jgi:hypothetical protein
MRIARYQSGDQIKKTEMGRACNTYGERRGASSLSSSSSSSLGATALREPWPPVLFASTGPYPELFFSEERCIQGYSWET